MQATEFVRKIRERTGVSEEEAPRMIAAFLRTLGERVTTDEAKDLRAQLAPELAKMLEKESGEEVKKYTADEFVKVFALRHDHGRAESSGHAKIIWDTLSEAVSSGEMDDIRSQLPDDYTRLFGPARQQA